MFAGLAACTVCPQHMGTAHDTRACIVSTPSGFSFDFCLDFVHAQREAESKAQVASCFMDNKSPRQKV